MEDLKNLKRARGWSDDSTGLKPEQWEAKKRFIKAQEHEFKQKGRGRDDYDRNYDLGRQRKVKKEKAPFVNSSRGLSHLPQSVQF